MNIINIITLKHGIVESIESFPIVEEQLSHEVIKQAEEFFIKKAIEIGLDLEEVEINDVLDEGYYLSKYDPEVKSVCIFWSYINGV